MGLREATVENPKEAQVDSEAESNIQTGCFQLGWAPGWPGLQRDPGGKSCSLLVSRPQLCGDSSVLHAGFLKILVA